MRKKCQAFTLIEVLVVIGIIGVIIALTFPVLSSIRRSTIEHKSLANMHTHMSVLQLYATDHRGILPFLTHPEADFTILRGGGEAVQSRFFGVNEYWFIGLTDLYYGSSLDLDLFAYPGQGGGIYLYSSTLFTTHEYWNPATRDTTTVQQWHPRRITQTRYPSSKVAYTESRNREGATPFPIWSNSDKVIKGDRFGFVFLDGSTRRPNTENIALPYQGGDGGGPQSRLGEIGVAGVHTVNGVLGRDIQ